MRSRLPIIGVGEVVPHEDPSQVQCNHWRFGTSLLPEGESVETEPVNGLLNGWTLVELHAIAHGVPCDCPIGRAHAEHGLLD